jgi:hypothetical protein
VNVVEHPDKLVFTNLGQFIPPSVERMLERNPRLSTTATSGSSTA